MRSDRHVSDVSLLSLDSADATLYEIPNSCTTAGFTGMASPSASLRAASCCFPVSHLRHFHSDHTLADPTISSASEDCASVRMTAWVRDLEPLQASVISCLSPMFEAQRDFRTLLVRKHPRAWCIHGYEAG